MPEDTDYGFGQGEGVLTVVQKVPLVAPAVAPETAEVATLTVVEPVVEPVEVREVPANDVIDVDAAKKPAGAKARVASDVGPDPKQEAAKTVSVKPVKKS